ncbi:MAG: sugar-binding protein, partial [Phycisphaerae bacterium]
MSKKHIYLVSFALVLGLAGYAYAAEADIEIPSVGYPKPILDGVMDDVWLLSTEQVMTLFTGEEPTSPEDCSASWWALWDEEYLYVLVNVIDEALIQDSDPSQGWLDDRVEIFIDGDNAKDDAPDGKNDYQYNFRWNHGEVETPVEWYFRATPHPSGSSLEGVEYGVATTDSGFLVEARMPWSTMTGEAPYEDQLIGINIMIDDDDDGGAEDTQFQWFTETTTPHVPSLWGTAVLVPGAGEPWLYVSIPKPADGDMLEDTWANLSWKPGGRAVSHDVYIGDNFDDVNDGAESTFQGNQVATFLVVGFPGFPFPDGLVPGTTYYWRIDEVNDTEPNSPWKGPVWSFSIPPKTAYNPDPADGAELLSPAVMLSWTPGFGAKLHTVYFGDNFDDVDNAAGGLPQGTANYTPGALKLAETYYWRVDEFDVTDTYKGHVWSFTTKGAVGSPDPPNGAVDVKHTPILTWSPGIYAASHQVYFGADKDAVKNADTSSPEYKGAGDLGAESYEPGKLLWDTTYYWRIDEANNANPDSPWTGKVWSFTTADFLVVDDFESYNDIDPPDPESNRIFEAWPDGYDIPTNGALVGNDLPPYAEQRIVHSGIQSMPYFYDNSVGYSEATHTLTYPRDWTENGVSTLSIWFRGNP